MKNNLLKKCTQLHDFSEQLYELGNNNNKYLIATSEQPISAFHSSEKIPFSKLPLRYSGFSTCFRKEGGSHGKDTTGIFRVHQFEKVEQFIIGKSNINSWKLYEEMLENSRSFYKTFNIPFHLINIPSGSINLTASKKIDILGFFPSTNSFRELVSCSNCTTHQSKKLLVEYKLDSKLKHNVPVSMLNSTLCATSRLICCICENYQKNNGISVPFVLRSYIGISFLPYLE
jgi:seryl-tRNA synthetase